MKELCQAIATLFNAGGNFATNLSNRFYLLEAPEDTDYPYAVYGWPLEIDHDWQFQEDFEEIDIGIEIFSESRAATTVLDLYNDCKSMFDEATLTISNYTPIRMRRTTSSLNKVENPTTGNMEWVFTVMYNVYLEKD